MREDRLRASAARRETSIAALDAVTGEATSWNPNARRWRLCPGGERGNGLCRRILYEHRRPDETQHRCPRRRDRGGYILEPKRQPQDKGLYCDCLRPCSERRRRSMREDRLRASAARRETTSLPSMPQQGRLPPGIQSPTTGFMLWR